MFELWFNDLITHMKSIVLHNYLMMFRVYRLFMKSMDAFSFCSLFDPVSHNKGALVDIVVKAPGLKFEFAGSDDAPRLTNDDALTPYISIMEKFGRKAESRGRLGFLFQICSFVSTSSQSGSCYHEVRNKESHVRLESIKERRCRWL